ncbi:MAG: cytochrome c [Rhodobacteraceae bacterium]|nr:cytochrome c [Paracoccaceae bacterium]
MKKMLKTAAVALVFGGAYVGGMQPVAMAQDSPTVIPELSEIARQGEVAYNVNCVSCHGINLAGTDKGPTFLHRVYVAGHHADMAFILAARRGVRAHHWRFGNMPPQPEISDEDLGAVITYIREIQAANGF